MTKFRKFNGRIVTHKLLTKPKPTKFQKGAVKIFYLCNQKIEANWKKTDIFNKRINCKNCKRILKK